MKIINNILNIVLTIVLVTFLASCSSDFLDKDTTGQISSSQIDGLAKNDPDAALKPLMQGLYSLTFKKGTGGTTGHDDFGQKSIDISLDFMCSDMAMGASVYSWFEPVYRYADQSITGSRSHMIWRYYYSIVRGANQILDALGGDEVIPEDPAKKIYFGQAKIIRAYAYFYLVNLYQHPYDEKKDKPGLPLYRSQVSKETKAQSKVSEVYNLIISDLEDAIKVLENYERQSKSEVDKYVAYGFLANACLFTGDYKRASEAAGEVINSGLFPLMNQKDVIESGFNSITIPSWMWGIDLTPVNTTALASFWGQVDYFTYGYASGDYRVIDNILYADMLTRPKDVRIKQFRDSDPMMGWWKFYDKNRIPDGDATWANDLVYMRVEEMYLLKAEAHARFGGQDPDAKAALKILLSLRDEDGAARIDAMNNTQLLEEIYYNWRAEMWGEGRSYFAMKRFKKTIKRGSNHLFLPGISKAYNDPKMIFEIPERELLNNPNLVPQQD